MGKYQICDSVCVSKFKDVFEKEYTSYWTTKILTKPKVQRTNPLTYLLQVKFTDTLLTKKILKVSENRSKAFVK